MSSSFLKLPQLSPMVMHGATACGIVNTSQHAALALYRGFISGRRLLFSLILSFDEYTLHRSRVAAVGAVVILFASPLILYCCAL